MAVSDALAALQVALQRLSSVLQGMQGAAGVQGGGAAGAPGGCGCAVGGTPAAARGARGAPDASASSVMQGPRCAPAAAVVAPSAPASTGGNLDVRSRIVATARAELARGVREDAGPDRDRAGDIRRYRSAVTGPGEDPDRAEPWCADFASWVWKSAGAPFGEAGRGEDSTRAMIAWAKQQGRWNPRGGDPPRPGDLVMIDWRGGGAVNHVAVVTEVAAGRVHTVGGNEGNGVKASSYELDDRRLIGYVPPAGG